MQYVLTEYLLTDEILFTRADIRQHAGFDERSDPVRRQAAEAFGGFVYREHSETLAFGVHWCIPAFIKIIVFGKKRTPRDVPGALCIL
jgi:hypothetical protein